MRSARSAPYSLTYLPFQATTLRWHSGHSSITSRQLAHDAAHLLKCMTQATLFRVQLGKPQGLTQQLLRFRYTKPHQILVPCQVLPPRSTRPGAQESAKAASGRSLLPDERQPVHTLRASVLSHKWRAMLRRQAS